MLTKKTDIAARQGGFTLIEILVALTILSIGILGIAGLAGTAVKNSGYSQAMTQANNLAQKKLEALLGIDYQNLEASDPTNPSVELQRACSQTDATASRPVFSCTMTSPSTVIGNRTFQWSYAVTYIDVDGSGTANPNQDGLKRIDVTVTWSDLLWNATKSITVATMRSRG